MTTATALNSALTAPFSSSHVEWRVGRATPDNARGRAHPCLAARAVQDRLDEACGPGGWKVEHRVVEANAGSGGARLSAIMCSLSLLIEGHWVPKEDVAEIPAPNADLVGHLDLFKYAVADAFKRAAVMWGVGRYLGSFEAPLVELDDKGRMTALPSLPDHMLPDGERGQQRRPAVVKPLGAQTDVAAAEPVAKAEATATAPIPAAKAGGTPPKAEAPAPEAKATTVDQPSDGGTVSPLAEALAALEGKALEVARNVVDRARNKAAPIPMLRNYLKGDAAQKLLSADVLTLLHAELDAAEGAKAATAAAA